MKSCFDRGSWVGPVLTGAMLVLMTTTLMALPPKPPAINTNNIIVITGTPYNAVGDGVTDNTLAISNAIVHAAQGGKTNGLFGGTVEIPAPGIFVRPAHLQEQR